MEYQINDAHLGYKDGQNDYLLTASLNDIIVGYVSYSEYLNKPYVNFIEVKEECRRQGIGTTLLLALQRKYAGIQINFGYTTPHGTKLLESLIYAICNPDFNVRLAKKVLKLEFRIKSLTKTHEDVTKKMLSLYFKIKERPLSEEEDAEYTELCEQDMSINSRLNDLYGNYNKLTENVDEDKLRAYNRLIRCA